MGGVYNQGEIKSERERNKLSVMDKQLMFIILNQNKNTLEWENKNEIVESN